MKLYRRIEGELMQKHAMMRAQANAESTHANEEESQIVAHDDDAIHDELREGAWISVTTTTIATLGRA